MANALTSSSRVIGREYPDPGENAIISEMIDLTLKQVTELAKNSRALRQVHTKMHAVFKGEFIIEKNLPEDLKIGLFKEEKSFPAWIRYSNGKTGILHDKKPDTRGMAIKLMNVQGGKLLESHRNENTLDLVMSASPMFFAKDLKSFKGLLKASIKGTPHVILFLLLGHWKMAYTTFTKIMIKCKHMMGLSYFSGTPYQFGDETRAVKYHLTPSASNQLEYTDQNDFDYLRKNIVATLNKHEQYFDFFIQFQTDADKMPIEDASVVWTSPFIKVARLRIPVQKFDTPDQDIFGDNLTFNIWHTLPEHRPLGGFNRGRKFIYEALYKFRSNKNNIIKAEPVATADFFNN